MKKLLALLSLTTAMVATAAQAQQLLTWDMQGNNSPATITAGSIAANLDTMGSLNTLSRTGLTQATANNSFASNNWNLSTFDESNKYISFTLAPVTGYEMTLTGLNYLICGSSTAPNTGRWGYSIGGGAFVLQDTFSIPSSTSSLATWNFTDFTTEDSVEFRFWSYGATSIGGGNSAATGAVRVHNISGNDLVLNGSVALVPEPSTVALLGLAGLGLAAHVIRRRRR